MLCDIHIQFVISLSPPPLEAEWLPNLIQSDSEMNLETDQSVITDHKDPKRVNKNVPRGQKSMCTSGLEAYILILHPPGGFYGPLSSS